MTTIFTRIIDGEIPGAWQKSFVMKDERWVAFLDTPLPTFSDLVQTRLDQSPPRDSLLRHMTTILVHR